MKLQPPDHLYFFGVVPGKDWTLGECVYASGVTEDVKIFVELKPIKTILGSLRF